MSARALLARKAAPGSSPPQRTAVAAGRAHGGCVCAQGSRARPLQGDGPPPRSSGSSGDGRAGAQLRRAALHRAPRSPRACAPPPPSARSGGRGRSHSGRTRGWGLRMRRLRPRSTTCPRPSAALARTLRTHCLSKRARRAAGRRQPARDRPGPTLCPARPQPGQSCAPCPWSAWWGSASWLHSLCTGCPPCTCSGSPACASCRC